MNKIISLCLILACLSCHKQYLFPDNPSYACDQLVTKRSQAVQIALVYSKQIDGYYFKSINLISPKSTTDWADEVVNVFCNLPDDYKESGKRITFDGFSAPILDTIGHAGVIKKTFHVGYYNYIAITKIY